MSCHSSHISIRSFHVSVIHSSSWRLPGIPPVIFPLVQSSSCSSLFTFLYSLNVADIMLISPVSFYFSVVTPPSSNNFSENFSSGACNFSKFF
jgi:hypothetical protein